MKINNETKVGLLAAVSIALLILGYNFLKARKIFTNTFELYARYETVDGLSVGNPIIYNGLRVGQVNSLHIDAEKGDIIVGFNIDQGLKIPVDSKASIFASDLLGSKALKILRGTESTYFKSGGYLEGQVEDPLSKRVNDEILPLKDKLEELLGQTERFMGWLNTTMDESNGNKIDNILTNFDRTTANFSSASYKVDTLLGSFGYTMNQANKILDNFRDQNENINRIFGNLGTFSDSLMVSADDMRAMMNQASSTIADIELVVEKIEDGEGSLGMLVNDPGLYNNVSNTIARIDTFLNDFDEDPRVDLYFKLGNKRNSKEAIAEKKKKQAEKEALKAAEKAAKAAKKEEKRKSRQE